MPMSELERVPFHGGMMLARRAEDGTILVALKPICENIGIDFNGQKQRLERTPWATMCVMHTVAADGKNRDMTAINRKTLTMWLATIDTSRLSNERAKENVSAYQLEAAEALDRYFNEGGAIRATDEDSDEDIMARALIIAQRTIERKNRQIEDRDERIRELEPKARALDDFTDVPDALLVRDAAKLLSNAGTPIGEKGLRDWLADHGWIYRHDGAWSASSSHVRSGHLVLVQSRSHGTRADGTPFAYPPTVRITRRGLALLHRHLADKAMEGVLAATA